jgi:hypothetical protein
MYYPSRIAVSLSKLFFLINVLFPSVMKAQLQPTNGNVFRTTIDSSQRIQRKTDDRIQINNFSASDTLRRALDSSIDNLHRSPILSIWENDLGNFATANTTIYFSPNMEAGNRLGIRACQSFIHTWDNTSFYNTTKPYTDLYYRVGTKQEQRIALVHSRNIHSRLNFTLQYAKEGSPGSYKLQRSNTDHFTISSHYTSINKRYTMLSGLHYNKIQQDENGGIESEDFLLDLNYNNKRLIPVLLDGVSGETNRSSVTNYYRNLHIQLAHQYAFGKQDSTWNEDSTIKQYRFQPQFGAKHTFFHQNNLYQYKDVTPDSLWYNAIGNFSFLADDSVFSLAKFHQTRNQFSLTGNLPYRNQILQSEAGIGLDMDALHQQGKNVNYLSTFLFASITKEAIGQQKWYYHSNFQFYFSGYNIGNMQLQALARKSFDTATNHIELGFEQTINNVSFLQNYFASNVYTWQQNAKKQITSKLFATYTNKKIGLVSSLRYYQLLGFAYRDTSLLNQQYNSLLPLVQASIQKDFSYRKFKLENEILLQFVSEKSPIHLPMVAYAGKCYFTDKLFMKKLQIATGLDIRYFSPFLVDAYSPIVYDFVTQYHRRVSNVPRTSYFFNFKVKTYRASLSFDELQQLFTRNNINYPGYAAQNFMVRFGFHWMMVN